MTATVIMPAGSVWLTSTENVRLDLNLSADEPSQQKLQRIIEHTSARAASFCNRTFGRATYRERFSGRDLGFEIPLDEGPVFAISSVRRGGVLLVPDVDYELEGGRLFQLRDDQRCHWSPIPVVVEYQAGWRLPGEGQSTPPAPDLPADVEHAVIQLIGVALSASSRDATVKSESVEGVGSTDWYVQGATASLPHPEAEAALTRYRRIKFA